MCDMALPSGSIGQTHSFDRASLGFFIPQRLPSPCRKSHKLTVVALWIEVFGIKRRVNIGQPIGKGRRMPAVAGSYHVKHALFRHLIRREVHQEIGGGR